MNSATDARINKFRVLIIDDHPIVRRGLTEMINQEPDLEVCGEAADMADALEQVQQRQPDVMVVDLSLKSGHGIDLIEQVKAINPSIRMLVSSMHDESLFAERALRAGALGYLSKQEPAGKLLDAIRQVARGEIYLSSAMSNRLLYAVVGGDQLHRNPIAGLSNRELEVFEMIGQGLATKQIAGRLHLSPKTIETHREKIKSKLNLTNSNELNRRAVQWVLENH